jgi:copper chaperone CopZ
MKRIGLIYVLLCITTIVQAQFVSSTIKASGLTCSMCSKSIDKALRTLDFVQDVKPDLATTSFEVSFKPGSKVNIDALKSKVEAAGFFVSDFSAVFHFEGQKVSNDFHFNFENSDYHFVDVKEQTLQGDVRLYFVDKGYMPSKKFKKYSKQSSFACLKTGATCTSPGSDRTYHVTL